MNRKLLCIAACLTLLTAAPVGAATQRLEAWGQGPSEFEAVKSAYKQLVAQALKLVLDREGASEGQLRRTFIRDIEEDLLLVQRTYFPEAAPPNCRETTRQFECLVVAPVQMEELEAKIRSLFDVTDGVHELRIALTSKDAGTDQRDLAVWLHGELEGDFGHDIYFSEQFVDAAALREGCAEYRSLAESSAAKGASFERTEQSYRRSFTACKDLLDRDLIIVLESAESHYGAFNARDRSMPGELRLRMQLLQTKSRRPLPAPPPKAITQYGYGDTPELARSELRDRLYDAVTNYVTQQLNEALLTVVRDGRVSPQDGERDYQVLITGANVDTPEGRKQVTVVRDWFTWEVGYELQADETKSTFTDRVYRFRRVSAPNWDGLIDKLHAELDKQGMHARLDVDRSRNLAIAFQSKDAKQDDALLAMKLEDARIKRQVVVEEKSLELRRRDPETGVAIAVYEAMLRIRNKSGKDLIVSVTPVWTGQDGGSLPAPYSYRQTLLLPAKTSERFTFTAPSKFAGRATVEISCTTKGCEVPK